VSKIQADRPAASDEVKEDGKGALITASIENGADGGAAIATAFAPKATTAKAAQLRRRRRKRVALGMRRDLLGPGAPRRGGRANHDPNFQN
jgi:hypothetical protein